ncbi:hypothetical protein KC799_11165 [candidate division KSB1 bacterium]|nr:hypothetical protein [candidate division KSB1 bacterium]
MSCPICESRLVEKELTFSNPKQILVIIDLAQCTNMYCRFKEVIDLAIYKPKKNRPR